MVASSWKVVERLGAGVFWDEVGRRGLGLWFDS